MSQDSDRGHMIGAEEPVLNDYRVHLQYLHVPRAKMRATKNGRVLIESLEVNPNRKRSQAVTAVQAYRLSKLALLKHRDCKQSRQYVINAANCNAERLKWLWPFSCH